MTMTRRCIVDALLWSCLLADRSIAFQPSVPARFSSIATLPRRGSGGVVGAGVVGATVTGNDGGREEDHGSTLLSRRAAVAGLAAIISGGFRVAESLAVEKYGDGTKDALPVPNKKIGLASKIRRVSDIMDELQRDLMQERWDLLVGYPNQLRSYSPVFSAYTDGITNTPRLRSALREEVGRFFVALERFRTAADRRMLDDSYLAYTDMSCRLDSYLRAGGLYQAYDDGVARALYAGNNSDPKKDPARVRDLVVLIKGPDVGRTGIFLGLYPEGSGTCAVKLDRSRGVREMRVVEQSWVGRRKGEQEPDEAFLIPESS